jgi:uncharacterized protein YggE
MADVPNEKLGNWRNVNNWLDEAGYKTMSSVESQSNNSLQRQPLVKIVNIGVVQNNQDTVTIDINIRVSLPSASEAQGTEDLDSEDS